MHAHYAVLAWRSRTAGSSDLFSEPWPQIQIEAPTFHRRLHLYRLWSPTSPHPLRLSRFLPLTDILYALSLPVMGMLKRATQQVR